ncbi:MAG: cytochrome c oxidase subunit 3 [Cytophagales bacterium]|nr:cytochrome c oxidase subunit 3 [Cytophagales bacterium]
MESSSLQLPANTKPLGMNPLKFALWLFIVSIVMIFASLTSAYIVRKSEGNWLDFKLPTLFYFTTAILVFCSIFTETAKYYAKRDDLQALKLSLSATFILGVAFLAGQWYAWKQLVAMNVFFVGNPSGSFVYVLSGLHALHIVGGIVFLLIVLYMTFKDKIHSKNMLWMEMCTTFWHFLDGLWFYLFLFLILNR